MNSGVPKGSCWGLGFVSLGYFKAHIAVVLDNFARTIYTEIQNNKE